MNNDLGRRVLKMSNFQHSLGKYIHIEISGNKIFRGILVDYGLDIICVTNNANFYYIPIVHIQQLRQSQDLVQNVAQPEEIPIHDDIGTISFRKVLQHAKGRFLEIYVTGNKTIHGYVTSIMNDYLVFHSPIYNTLYVSMHHLKWIIPYNSNKTPYLLDTNMIPFTPTSASLARSFKDQCKKMEDKLVVFDLGDHPDKIGKLKAVDTNTNMLELIVADGESVYWNLQHLKTLFIP
jgi:small nuclear ribonucleoprotein (snRNP)-like protein